MLETEKVRDTVVERGEKKIATCTIWLFYVSHGFSLRHSALFFVFCNLHIRQKKFFFVLFLPERIRHSGQVYSGPVIKPLRVVESSRSEMTLSLSQSQIVSTLVWRTFRSQSWRDISAFRLISRYFPKRNSKSAQKRKSNQSGNRSRSGRQGQRFFVLFFLKHSAKVWRTKKDGR